MAQFTDHPKAYAQHLIALDIALSPPIEIVLAGGLDDPNAERFLPALRRMLRPEVLLILSREKDQNLTSLVPATANKPPLAGKTTAYVCRNRHCLPPSTTVEQMLRQLQGPEI
jgi:uncharacterized protein YyaL (SSP411 family)